MLLKITRDSGYADKFRDYKLFVDGMHIGSIGEGQYLEIEMPDDSLEFQVKIDWTKSKPIYFDGSSKTAEIRVFSKLRGFALFGAIMALFMPNSYIGAERID